MLRKGQRLINYFTKEYGWKNENVHQAIFYMTDEEFDSVIKGK